jgi:ribosomal-protein-alanine N-acetyltransferase
VAMRIESTRIFLRKITPEQDNLGDYLLWLRDVEGNQYIESVSIDYSMNQLIEYITEKNLQESSRLFGIFLLDDNQMIGTIKLEPIDIQLKFAWLGILIGHSDFRGQGYGKEAIKALLQYANLKLGLTKIYLGVDPANSAALRLYESIGFVPSLEKINTMSIDLPLLMQP